MIKLENIQVVNYVETSVECEHGLLLILTLINTDLSLTFHFSVKIKVLNFKITFSGHFFKNSVKFMNLKKN